MSLSVCTVLQPMIAAACHLILHTGTNSIWFVITPKSSIPGFIFIVLLVLTIFSDGQTMNINKHIMNWYLICILGSFLSPWITFYVMRYLCRASLCIRLLIIWIKETQTEISSCHLFVHKETNIPTTQSFVCKIASVQGVSKINL